MKKLLCLILIFTMNELISQDTYTYVNPNHGLSQDSMIDLYDIRLGDINGDGYIDILKEESYIPYYGGSEFGDKVSLVLAENIPTYFDVEDVNDDGFDDFSNNRYWIENLKNNQFSQKKERPDYVPFYTPPLPLPNGMSISAADYDGDGDVDRILYSQLKSAFFLYENIDDTHYLDTVRLADSYFLLPSYFKEIKTGDFNNDGLIDVVIITTGELFYFHNNGDMNFSTPVIYEDIGYSIRRWDIKDIDNDGFLDIVLGTIRITGGSGYGEVLFYKGSEEGLTSATKISSDLVDDVRFGIKEDGTCHIYSTFESDVYEHTLASNSISFDRTKIITGANGNELVIKDVDSDGDIDIITHFGIGMGYYLKNEDVTFDSFCPDYDVEIEDQGDMDFYKLNFSHCRDFQHSLTINGEVDGWSKITTLAPFSELESIAGDFSLIKIIRHDISPFSNLKHIGGDFNINHLKVEDLTGFRSLEQVDGSLNIELAWPLDSNGLFLDGGYDFNDLENFTKLGRDIHINNARFANIDKIITGPVIKGDLYLWLGIDDLSNLQLLTEVTGSIFIGRSNAQNDQMGLKNLKRIGGDFTLIDNKNLTNLSFLNDELTVDGEWDIRLIAANMDLCGSAALCNHITSGKIYDINASNIACYTDMGVDCTDFIIDNEVPVSERDNPLVLYPNPSASTLNISILNKDIEIVEFEILTIEGSAIQGGDIPNNSSISIGDLRNGLYLLKARGVANEEAYFTRFMKQSF